MRFLLSTLVLIFAGCVSSRGAQSAGASEGSSASGLPAEIDRVLRDYERAWTAKDAAALAELFTEDGFVLASNKPPVQGRAAIKEAYADAGGPLILTPLSFTAQGIVGYIIGVYGHDQSKLDSGKFILALRRDKSGRWMIAADIDNSSEPVTQ